MALLNPERRRFLKKFGSLGILSISGCVDDEDTYSTIRRITLLNASDIDIRVAVRIEAYNSEESLYESKFDIPSDKAKVIKDEWPNGALRIQIKRRGESDWNQYVNNETGGCVSLVSEIRKNSISFLTSNKECSDK